MTKLRPSEAHEGPIRRVLASGQGLWTGGSIWLPAYHVKKKHMYFSEAMSQFMLPVGMGGG